MQHFFRKKSRCCYYFWEHWQHGDITSVFLF